MEPTTIPPALRKGDTIALVSPSARLNTLFPHRLARATAWLERAGYRVKEIYDPDLPENPRRLNVAGRAAELHAAFADPVVKAIVCVIGGSTNNELLPALDSEILRANPKIFIGTSDTTLLQHFCAAAAGLRTFYGPSALTQLAEWPAPLPFTWAHFERVLTDPHRPVGQLPRSETFTDEFCAWEEEEGVIERGEMRARTMKPARGWKWLRPGTAEGPLWGGCLPSLLQLMGTRWEVSYEGKVALIELPEGDAPATGIPLERAIWHLNDLRLRGVFDAIAGLVVGRPYLYSAAEEAEWEAAVSRAAEGYAWPILAGVDVGHSDPMLTLPLGARARLDSARNVWEVLEAGVVP